jgi:hypothetical protein
MSGVSGFIATTEFAAGVTLALHPADLKTKVKAGQTRPAFVLTEAR